MGNAEKPFSNLESCFRTAWVADNAQARAGDRDVGRVIGQNADRSAFKGNAGMNHLTGIFASLRRGNVETKRWQHV